MQKFAARQFHCVLPRSARGGFPCERGRRRNGLDEIMLHRIRPVLAHCRTALHRNMASAFWGSAAPFFLSGIAVYCPPSCCRRAIFSLPIRRGFARLLRRPIGNVAAVAEWRLHGLLAAAQRDREVLGRRIADRPVRCAAMRAIAIGLPLATSAGAPDHQFAGTDLRPIGPIGHHRAVSDGAVSDGAACEGLCGADAMASSPSRKVPRPFGRIRATRQASSPVAYQYSSLAGTYMSVPVSHQRPLKIIRPFTTTITSSSLCEWTCA